MNKLDAAVKGLAALPGGSMKNRLAHEIDYARRVSQALKGRHEALVLGAARAFRDAVARDGALTDAEARRIEESLLPMQADCKKYTLMLCGHAHIDMNWMWRYDETVQITLDTFYTVMDLMDEFPEFTFSQSQASVYRIVEEYDPELLKKIAARVKEGRWEVTASTWVEADRNMPSSEAVARHQLYTRRYLPKLLDSDKALSDLDFEPDTFGHHQNTPELLNQAGIKHYYHCRGYGGHVLYRWRSPSGAEVISYREPYWYLGPVEYSFATHVPAFCEQHGVTAALRVYGVGDHGGGPTRRDLMRIQDMMTWPIFPKVAYATFKEFFAQMEPARDNLPVVEGELNAIFPGCYTSQSRIKKGNRYSERLLAEAEGVSAFAHLHLGTPYNRAGFEAGWRNVLFNQFHDILPGSGVTDTREYAMGIYQQAYAAANSARRIAMNAIAKNIDTSSVKLTGGMDETGPGAGVGFQVEASLLPAPVERGMGPSRLYHLFNACAFDRHELAELTLWDYRADVPAIVVKDAKGNTVPHQVLESGRNQYWGHDFVRLLVDAKVPAMGYATYLVEQGEAPVQPIFSSGDPRVDTPENWIIENEYLSVCCDPAKMLGAIEIIDKESGDSHIVPGFALAYEDASRGMTSWTLGQMAEERGFFDRVKLKRTAKGDLYNELTVHVNIEGDSHLTYKLSLAKGSRMVNIDATCHWLLQGNQEWMPHLRFDALDHPFTKDGVTGYLYDIPGGFLMREPSAQDKPGLRFVAGESLALHTDSKYGYRANDDGIGVTLLRSSTDPDRYPEAGIHTFRLGIGVTADRDAVAMSRQAQQFASPLLSTSGKSQKGTLPMDSGFLRHVSGDVELYAVKLAEDSCKLIVRGAELAGGQKPVRLELNGAVKNVRFVDTHEKPVKGEVEADGSAVTFIPRSKGVFTLEIELKK